MVVDEAKLHEFIGKAVVEWGAAYGVLLTFVGDRLGLFKAMAGAGGALTPEELAKKTGTHPRIINEWLCYIQPCCRYIYAPRRAGYCANR
jgi:hypothetical protein